MRISLPWKLDGLGKGNVGEIIHSLYIKTFSSTLYLILTETSTIYGELKKKYIFEVDYFDYRIATNEKKVFDYF